MEKARDGLIDLLLRYRARKPHDITVVFDGHKGGAGPESAAVRGGVKIIYSRLGERADDVIKRIISGERRAGQGDFIVVSSDREVARHAWSANAVPLPSEEFYEIISRHAEAAADGEAALTPEQAGEEGEFLYDKDDESESSQARQGNPRRLSKRERAVRKALGKL